MSEIKKPPTITWICFDCAKERLFAPAMPEPYSELGQCSLCGKSIVLVFDIDDLYHAGEALRQRK